VLADILSTRAQRLAQVVTLLIAVVMFGLMTWQATIRSITNMRTGEYVGALQIPIWPIRMLFAFGCLLTFLVLVSQLFAHFTHKAETDGTDV
jgi:TRAP-type C4-dicarboxylate transport system permease small subunit